MVDKHPTKGGAGGEEWGINTLLSKTDTLISEWPLQLCKNLKQLQKRNFKLFRLEHHLCDTSAVIY